MQNNDQCVVVKDTTCHTDNTVNRYLILYSFREMLNAIDSVYKVDDLNFNICNTMLHKIHAIHTSFESITDKMISFIKSNSDTILNKQLLSNPIFSLNSTVSVDLQTFVKKKDVHTDILYKHLNVILFFANKGISNEEIYINKLIETLLPKCKEIAEYIKSNTADQENIELIGNTFKPSLDELNDNDDYNPDIMVKIIFIKLRSFFNTTPLRFVDIAGDKIHEESVMDLIDMCIVDDLETLNENKFDILKLVSKSGILSHFPLESVGNFLRINFI